MYLQDALLVSCLYLNFCSAHALIAAGVSKAESRLLFWVNLQNAIITVFAEVLRGHGF